MQEDNNYRNVRIRITPPFDPVKPDEGSDYDVENAFVPEYTASSRGKNILKKNNGSANRRKKPENGRTK